MSAAGSRKKRGRGIDEATRRQLVDRARRQRSRTAAFTRDRPTDWRPTEVRNPNGVLDSNFTHSTAWDFIASRLEAGEEVEVIELQQPAGTKGYVMKIDLGLDVPKLYVKLQLGPRRLLGGASTTRSNCGGRTDHETKG